MEDPAAAGAQALAEVHVLARLERGVEPAGRVERVAADDQVAAAEPGRVRHRGAVIAEPVVHALDPRAAARRVVRGADRDDRRGRERLQGARQPSGRQAVIGVDEGEDGSRGVAGRRVAHLGDPQAGE